MAVGGVKGDSEGPEATGPERKKKTDSEAFREMMKVDKTREVDPEEKRKRKQRHEAEEEAKAEMTKPSREPGPADRTSLFESGTKFELGSGAAAGAPEGAEPPPPSGAPPSTPPPFVPPSEPGDFPSLEEQEAVQEPQKSQAPAKKKRKKTEAPPPAKKKVEKAESQAKKAAPEMIKGAPLKKAEKKYEEKPVVFEKPKKPEKIEEKKKPEAPEQIAETPQSLPKGSWETTKSLSENELKLEKKEKVTLPPVEEEPTTTTPQAQAGLAAPAAEAAPPLRAPFANLPPQVQQLFEKMAGVMTVMTQTGVSETTIFLDAPQYANSAFFGSQIVITEFSTAKGNFNIELKGDANAVNLFQGNVGELVKAFNEPGRYTFNVNRIDTSIAVESKAEKARRLKQVKRKKGK